MPEASLQIARDFILYEDSLTPRPQLDWLSPSHWHGIGALGERLGGRGQVWQVSTPVGPAVLRRYQRGGWIQGISRDHYLYLGAPRSRAVREFRLLQQLRQRHLPVPEPLLASCERGTGGSWQSMAYTCGLLSREIPNAQTLMTLAPKLDSQDWEAIGGMLGRFFKAGLWHPDLNASNVVRDGDHQWWLLDFDKAHCSEQSSRPEPMLKRLKRSMDKHQLSGDQAALRAGMLTAMGSAS